MGFRVFCHRLRQTTEQVEDVMFRHLESRVAKALLQLVESVGLRALHSSSVELHVSQRELGNMAGGTRESVNNGLRRLVFAEHYDDMRLARQRERNMKHWRRAWKVRLILAQNPDWEDLYDRLA